MKTCIHCKVPLKDASSTYKGVRLSVLQCPQCKQKIFTEEMAKAAMIKLESKKLEKAYIKYPMKIGSSLGITFPKEMVDVFGLDKKTKIKLLPKPGKGKIEMWI